MRILNAMKTIMKSETLVFTMILDGGDLNAGASNTNECEEAFGATEFYVAPPERGNKLEKCMFKVKILETTLGHRKTTG